MSDSDQELYGKDSPQDQSQEESDDEDLEIVLKPEGEEAAKVAEK